MSPRQRLRFSHNMTPATTATVGHMPTVSITERLRVEYEGLSSHNIVGDPV